MTLEEPDYNTYTEEEKLELIRRRPMLIANFNDPSEELQLVAVTSNPECLHKIKNHTDRVAKAALTEFRRRVIRSDKNEI